MVARVDITNVDTPDQSVSDRVSFGSPPLSLQELNQYLKKYSEPSASEGKRIRCALRMRMGKMITTRFVIVSYGLVI